MCMLKLGVSYHARKGKVCWVFALNQNFHTGLPFECFHPKD